MTPTVLLIDDKEDSLIQLTEALKNSLGAEAEVLAWVPKREEGKPAEKFVNLLQENDVRLVITDYDLTEGGQLGFFGATVVDWCQHRGIPVGDFSRGHASSLAQEPNLFELRVPIESNEAAVEYVAAVFRGFIQIRVAIDTNEQLLKQRSPAAALAVMLDAKNMESQFSLYGGRYGSANSSLIDRFAATAPKDVKPEPQKKAALLAYIMGHLLVNAVLRFPGPIMSKEALAAYLAVDVADNEKYSPTFEPARYSGPFSTLNAYYWTPRVEQILASFEEKLVDGAEFESPGEFNRERLEAGLKERLTRSNACERCAGKNGGFLCPFSARTVCQRSDCSVVSNVWIPAGARLSRFEKEFYDEWAPILGM